MPKGRRPLIGGRAARRAPVRIRVLFFLFPLVCGLWSIGCQKTDDLLQPGSVPSNVVVATYISSEQFAINAIKLDGQALEREWGGPLDPERPFTQIRMTAEEGSGFPGPPIYLSAKAVYTDHDLFLLLQWADPQPDEMKDAIYYIGPDLVGRSGCQSILMDDAVWRHGLPGQVMEEDRLTLAFEIEPAGDDKGTYREQGCQVACHLGQTPAFGRLGHGRLDVWMWLAARTNMARNLYSLTDDPNSPALGTPGYLEDYSADSNLGLVRDPGQPAYLSNFVEGHTRPKFVYRPRDDAFADPADAAHCFNKFGERCKPNNGLPLYYLWREDRSLLVQEFWQCDSLNYAVLPQGQEARPWRPGDAVSAYYYTYPEESLADVRGKALHSLGVWTLEIARPLNTLDADNDIIFEGIVGDEVVFTAAVANNSRTVHWGSGPQILRFGPKPVNPARTLREGEAR